MPSPPAGLSDSRFAHVAWDPRYRRVPRAERRLKVDGRFAAMFTQGDFVMDNKVDRRGRPVTRQPDAHLREYYELSDGGGGEDEDEDEGGADGAQRETLEKVDTAKRVTRSKPSKKAKLKTVEQSAPHDAPCASGASDLPPAQPSPSPPSDGEDDRSDGASPPPRLDLARGEGNVSTSDDDDGRSSSDDEWRPDEETGPEHGWAELDKDAKQVQEATRRLAVVNQDWDAVRAADLYVLADSFKPAGGTVHRVAVYASDFGKRRMEEERLSGPAELRRPAQEEGGDSDEASEDDEEDVEEGTKKKTEKSKRMNERIRAYQLARLRYYYAVVACDSGGTAERIYEQCDRMQLEASANQLDLRFVADDIAFDEADLRDEATPASVDAGRYEPVVFANSAMGQVRATLTWEQADRRRAEIMRTAFVAAQSADTMEKIDEEKLRQVIASGSSSEGDDDSPNLLADRKRSVGNARQLLLQQAEEDTKESNPFAKCAQASDGAAERRERDMEMSITWQPAQFTSDVRGGGDDDSSDESDGGDRAKAAAAAEKRDKATKRKKRSKVHAEDDEQSAALGMLVAGDDGEAHYDLQALIKRQKKAEKLAKKKGANKPASQRGDDDNFALDVDDDRFAAVFSDQRYNVDPSSAHYKRTAGMHTLVAAKAAKRNKRSRVEANAAEPPAPEEAQAVAGEGLSNPTVDLAALKRKSEILLQSRKERLGKLKRTR